jgi:hypothetical protein
MYPDAVAEFIFDQSSAHGAFAKDALNTKDMNVKPGGRQRKMHDTYIPIDNPNPLLHGVHQTMVFPHDLEPGHPDYQFRGQAKGMYCVLEEHGLVSVLEAANQGKAVGECQICKMSHEAREQMQREAQAVAEGGKELAVEVVAGNGYRDGGGVVDSDSRRTDCCMRKMLANQQDFKEEKPLSEIIIEKAGHKCWFLPKFHCELNPIELYWGWAKAREFVTVGMFGN